MWGELVPTSVGMFFRSRIKFITFSSIFDVSLQSLLQGKDPVEELLIEKSSRYSRCSPVTIYGVKSLEYRTRF